MRGGQGRGTTRQPMGWHYGLDAAASKTQRNGTSHVEHIRTVPASGFSVSTTVR